MYGTFDLFIASLLNKIFFFFQKKKKKILMTTNVFDTEIKSTI